MPQAAALRNPDPLTERPRLPEKPRMTEKASVSDPRKARLARALTANIARRKEQARTREAGQEPPEPPREEGHCRN